jgi:hypothetical protein
MSIVPSAHFVRGPILLAGLAIAVFAAARVEVAPRAVAAPAAAATQTLLEGVRQIAAPGVPGPLAVFGGKAFAVVAGQTGGDHQAAVVAAAAWKSGRVVAFGHTGYLDGKTLAIADTGRLMLNAVCWAGKTTAIHRDRLRVAVWHQSGLLAFLKQQGINAESLEAGAWPHVVSSCQVVCLDSGSLSEGQVRAVGQFVQQGGGLVAASLGWGWLQLHLGKTLLADHPGNRLLAPAGIVWLDGALQRTAVEGYAAGPPPRLCHAMAALEALGASAKGGKSLDKQDMAQALATVIDAVRGLPPDDRLLRPALERIERAYVADIVPTAKQPLTAANPLGRLALTLHIESLRRLPPEAIRAEPAAAAFPGLAPDDAPRVTRSVAVDTAVPDWHSTGLYAAPGEVITATVAAGSSAAGLWLRIGAHRDTLWHKDSWSRWPEICVRTPLTAPTTRLASPLGGMIYVEVGSGAPPGRVSLSIAHAVEAAYFVLGETELSRWRDAIRSRPAPWAELASDKVILTVPAREIRSLDDPAELMRYWDRVLDCDAELAGIPAQRRRPERYLADVQISVGYMHSGYPIMTHLDAAPLMVSKSRLTDKGQAWGLYHEMGHNHQSSDWTFEGTTEVTVNLFSLYVIEKLCGCPAAAAHPAIAPAARAKALAAYVAGGRSFETWKKEPFLALQMYMQLIEGFGWDPLKRVIAEYRKLPAAEHPKTDEEKRDQWMVRYSQTVGRNLGPFFAAWGVPTSASARASIAQLPGWMPSGLAALAPR